MKRSGFLALTFLLVACGAEAPTQQPDTTAAVAPDTGAGETLTLADTSAPPEVDTTLTPAPDTSQSVQDSVEADTASQVDTAVMPEDTAPELDTMSAPDVPSSPEDGTAAESGTVILAFRHMDKGWSSPLSYNETGTSTAGEPFSYDFLRYWVTNVSFQREDGSSYAVPGSFYLVEETPQNTRLDVQIEGVPAGSYQSVTFSIGVDKAHNASLDLMEGELSVNVGMSWNWNTGYIFLKVEGKLGGGNTKFKMHVGTDENYRVITKDFSAPVLIDSTHPAKIWLRADVSRLFDNLPPGPYFFSISPLAKIVADNYGSWFDDAEVTAP